MEIGNTVLTPTYVKLTSYKRNDIWYLLIYLSRCLDRRQRRNLFGLWGSYSTTSH